MISLSLKEDNEKFKLGPNEVYNWCMLGLIKFIPGFKGFWEIM